MGSIPASRKGGSRVRQRRKHCRQAPCLPVAQQKPIGSLKIMGLTRRQVKAGRITRCVDGGVDFRAQSAFTAADRLIFAAFLCAPALCLCARTIVASIIAYSLSASCARCLKTLPGPDPDPTAKRVCIIRKSQKRCGKSRQGMLAR
jgi:hypothetical protein